MRQTIWTGTCAAIVTVATAAIFAQTPAQQPPAQQPPAPAPAPQTSTPSASANKVTVTGCLKAAPPAPGDEASPAGTAGTAGTTPAPTAGAPAAGATGTTGAATAKFILTDASATPADAASAQTYRLIANPTALSEHVGKKLELVGTIDTTSAADPKDPSAAAPALRVESGKILAATCTQ